MERARQRSPSPDKDTPIRAKATVAPLASAQLLLHLQRSGGNAAVSSLLTRAGAPVALQRQPAPADDILAPSKGPQGRARDDANNALLIASDLLASAIEKRDNNGLIPPIVFRAYNRFFPGSGLDRLDQLKSMIDHALIWTAGIPFDVIPNPVPAGYRDAAIHAPVLAANLLGARAMFPPNSADEYVAIYPAWSAADPNMRAAVIIHELFHFFPGVKHVGAEPPWQNARAYQGFVTTVAGLPELPGITAMFPP